jgi:hypothetical protein
VYAIPLELLREVITLRSVTAVPMIGDAWEGIFFHRGMCHGLARLSGDKTSSTCAGNAAILDSPERCGIGMTEIYGNFKVPVSEIVKIPEGDDFGLFHRCGKVEWEDKDVTILAVRTRAVGAQGNLLGTGGGKH